MTRQDVVHTGLDRRDFIVATAGFSLALTVFPDRLAFKDQALADSAPLALNVWLTIATDGTISIVSPAAEMGQGTFTTLPAILPDELDADWSKVRPIIPSQWDEKK